MQYKSDKVINPNIKLCSKKKTNNMTPIAKRKKSARKEINCEKS